MAIALRKPQEIEKLRAANKIVGGALELLSSNTKVGASLKDLGKKVFAFNKINIKLLEKLK